MRAARNANVRTPRQCALVLKALGDETRLRILESLLVVEKCVTDLVQELGCSQPHASHHLRILRDSGLVEGHRCGKQVCYRVTPEIQRALAKGKDKPWTLVAASYGFPSRP